MHCFRTLWFKAVHGDCETVYHNCSFYNKWGAVVINPICDGGFVLIMHVSIMIDGIMLVVICATIQVS